MVRTKAGLDQNGPDQAGPDQDSICPQRGADCDPSSSWIPRILNTGIRILFWCIHMVNPIILKSHEYEYFLFLNELYSSASKQTILILYYVILVL